MSISTTSTPKRSSANATRNVPCSVCDAVSGIRFDSGERSSVERRSPARDSSTICHWVTRRIARDSPARNPYASSSPHSAESASTAPSGSSLNVRYQARRCERLLDRDLVDDDGRAVCGARREHRVAQARRGRADDLSVRFGRAIRDAHLVDESEAHLRTAEPDLAIAASDVLSPVGRDQERRAGSDLREPQLGIEFLHPSRARPRGSSVDRRHVLPPELSPRSRR